VYRDPSGVSSPTATQRSTNDAFTMVKLPDSRKDQRWPTTVSSLIVFVRLLPGTRSGR
jgi:hypothetical protein